MNSYDSVKSSKRSTHEPHSVSTAPARSNQEKAVSGGERTVTPQEGKNRSFGNQLQIAPVKDRLKTALNDYDSVNLGACNQDPNLDGHQPSGRNKTSPARNVGQGKP